jgi:hypothetical protein
MKTERPVFLYSMTPVEKTAVKNFFELGELTKLLENPGQLRDSGWDLNTRAVARIVKGEYMEVTSADRKRIQVYEDGSVFVRVSGDEDMLSWGQNTDTFEKQSRLNTLALIEFTLNFCILCSRLIPLLERPPREISVKVDIRNAFFGDSKLFLIPYPVSTWTFAMTDSRFYAPEQSMSRKVVVTSDRLETRPDVVAYELLKQIFYWFGTTHEIPYTSSENGLRYVDKNLIINSRSMV